MHACHPELKRQEFTWVREDTVVCIATHLDDERCLQASVSRLIDAIMEQKDNPAVRDAHTMTFSHTNALHFSPSFYAYSPSTLGIAALARLGFRIDPALLERVAEICQYSRFMKMSDETGESLAQGADAAVMMCHPTPYVHRCLLSLGKRSPFL
ncbi:hypothetical protein EV702DRAFT_1197414 [Suillus placidus]|uniref:Uncharacterized protein n=1 Tax=Suillus placidus TaxID=48579 RepID=A0A9P6ZVS0_9AGAM|nr:hypothetical protein EV702DRAFT_1197414 [Suillus placidus]